MDVYSATLKQPTSLNIFDICRRCGSKVFGFSGTFNNMIASKMHSIGYQLNEVSLLNFYPIKRLYQMLCKTADGKLFWADRLSLVPMTSQSFDEIKPWLTRSEREDKEDKKNLIVFPTIKSIGEFKQEYEKAFGRSISAITITSEEDHDTNSEAFLSKLTSAKYILSIDMVSTGFDISTFINGVELYLGILFRNMDDKISQPLSKNKEHDLHMEAAARFLQLIARARMGGVFLVPSGLHTKSLYERMCEVSDIIHLGHNDCLWAGSTRSTQGERIHQGILQAIIQNLKENNRPVVQGSLDKLLTLSGRNLEEEYRNSSSPSEFDSDFWISAIEDLWGIYLIEHEGILRTDEQKKNAIQNLEKSLRQRTMIHSGGGVRDAREMEAEVREQVKARAGGICGHCGFELEEDEETQDGHVKRYDCGGTFTLNNILRVHRACDCSYDSSDIIHDPAGGVWLHRRCQNHIPDMKQVAGISKENIIARWEWVKGQFGKEGVSDYELRTFLAEKKYSRK